MYFSHGVSNSRGVMILIKKSLSPFRLLNLKCDGEG